jgi:tetratricopeptide (TPR) repeat protein
MQTVTIQTDIGQLIGTIPYMSPEQVTGDSRNIDTRSDVYSLGVVLFELLSGRLPYDLPRLSIPEAVRKIQEEEPIHIGSVKMALRGDLDAILSMALEKDVARRYQSADALAADLRRYLAYKPIEARPASTLYQLRKFTRRNKALVGGFAVAVLALLIGFGVSLYGFVKTSRERDAKELALRNETAARELSDEVRAFLKQILKSPRPDRMGYDVTVKEVLDRAGQRLDKQLADRPLLAAELHETIGQSYIGLGLVEQAEQHFRQSIDLYSQIDGVDARRIIEVRNALTAAFHGQGRIEEALAEGQALLDWIQTNVNDDDRMMAGAMHNMALFHTSAGELAFARDFLQKALVLLEREGDRDDVQILKSKNKLAEIYIREMRLAEAENILDDILEDAIRAFGYEHPRTLSIRNNHALVLMNTDPGRAVPLLSELLKDYSRIFGPTYTNTLNTYANLGVCLIEVERFDEAKTRTYPKTGNRAFDRWEHIRKSLFFRHLRCAQYL